MPDPTPDSTPAPATPEPATPEPATPEPPPKRFTPVAPSGMSRLLKAVRRRPDLGHVAVAALVGLLGFAAVLQVRGDEDDTLSNARRDELLQILDGLTRQGDRLEEQVAELETSKRDLVSGADTEQAALEQAQDRARQLGILAGTEPALGPGIVVTINDPDYDVRAATILSAVQELRDSGAEAIQIEGQTSGQAVRVVASSFFLDDDDGEGIVVSDVELDPPYSIAAIGDAPTLSEAMEFPQGVISKVENDGGEAHVTPYGELAVDVLHEQTAPEYARPAGD